MVHQPIAPENIIFTEYTENLKLINVDYDHKEELSEQDTQADIRAYGEVLGEVLDHLPGVVAAPAAHSGQRRGPAGTSPYRSSAWP